MERAERMAMIPVEIGWSDIGSWASVFEELANKDDENVVMGDAEHIAIDSHGTLINSERLVVTIGMEDVVIVDTDDVLMICRRDQAQAVKKAVQHLKDNDMQAYL